MNDKNFIEELRQKRATQINKPVLLLVVLTV